MDNIGIIVSGGTPSTKIAHFWNGEIPWITPADLSNYKEKNISKGSRNITEQGLLNSAAKVIPKGSIMFSSRAPIGYVAISENEIATNQGFKNIIPTKSLNSDFVYYYLKSIKDLAEQMASGTTFLELSANKFAKLPIPIPPIQEQQRIVAKLEELFSELDYGITNLSLAKKQLKIYRQVILNEAFNGRLTGEWRLQNRPPSGKELLKSIESERQQDYVKELATWEDALFKWKETKANTPRPKKPGLPKPITYFGSDVLDKLPNLPEGWVYSQVDELLEYGRDCAYGVVQPGGDVSKGVKLIRVGDINDGKVYTDNLKVIKTEIAERHKRTFLQGGEVLISLVGAIGRTAVVPLNLAGANIARAVGVMPISRQINADYYELSFRQPKKVKEMTLLAHEVARKTLNIEDVKSTKVILCSREEQDKIASIISYQFSIADTLDDVINETLEKLEALKQCVLKDAFQGKLSNPNEKDEPAQLLLSRIKIEIKEYLSIEKDKAKGAPKKIKMENKELDILEILTTAESPMTAKSVWEQSKYKNDIESFYAELKKVENKVTEVKKGVLALIK